MNFLIVFYRQAVRGFDPLKAALLLIPLPLVASVMAPLSGWVADRIGARLLATIGLLIQAAALVCFAGITATTAYPEIAAGLGVMGVGGGLFYPPNTSAAMNASPMHRLGVASATLSTLHQAGMVTSFALSLAVAAGNLGSQTMQDFVLGMHSAFLVSVVLCLVAATISMVGGKEDRRFTQNIQAGQMKPVK